MSKRRLGILGVAFVACLSLPSLARAQSAGASLSEVQKAYADVDYERTRSLAAAAVQRGGADRASTGELYLLWATAAAALDRADEARTAFSYAIAANPTMKVDRNLSPKIRAPYLEARGAIASTDARAPLEVTLRRHRQGMQLELHDVLHVAANVVVATRAPDGAFTHRRFAATPTREIATPQSSELQFFLQVLDRYGNVLCQLGREDEPERLAQVASNEPRLTPPTRAGAASPLPYYVTSGALAVLGVAAGGVATAMYLQREDAAQEWNSPACERPGLTRAQQCGPVDDRRRRSESLTVGFACGGGALLVGSLVSLLLAPAGSPARADVVLDAGPSRMMLRMSTSL